MLISQVMRSLNPRQEFKAFIPVYCCFLIAINQICMLKKRGVKEMRAVERIVFPVHEVYYLFYLALLALI